MPTLPSSIRIARPLARDRAEERKTPGPEGLHALPGRALVERFDIEPYSDFSAKRANFRGLVLCCIDAKFCKKIFVGKLLTRSTRFACFCTAQTSIFQQKFVKLFGISGNILKENLRWKALDEIYKIYMLLHRSDLNISAKFRETSSSFCSKF